MNRLAVRAIFGSLMFVIACQAPQQPTTSATADLCTSVPTNLLSSAYGSVSLSTDRRAHACVGTVGPHGDIFKISVEDGDRITSCEGEELGIGERSCVAGD